MRHPFSRLLRSFLSVVLLGVLAACSTPPEPDGINDPFEGANRAMHGFNKAVDQAIVRDLSRVYVEATPEPIVFGLANAFNNLDSPSDALNGLMQGDVDGVTYSTLRFLTNTTLGIGGLFDVATEMGIPQYDTDFGETLFVWGVGEGPYYDVPFFGPHTGRRLFGRGVDWVIDPLGRVGAVVDGAIVFFSLYVVDSLKLRDDRRQVIDDAFYNSADSYAKTRILYLQNRRFTLGQRRGADYLDPYLDPYDASGADVPLAGDFYVDPYEDPYAQ